MIGRVPQSAAEVASPFYFVLPELLLCNHPVFLAPWNILHRSKISWPGMPGQAVCAAGTRAAAGLAGHQSPTPHFQSFSSFSLASPIVSLLHHFNSTKWNLCYCPYLLSMSSGSYMLSLLSETSFYCCQHCGAAVPAEQQAACSALPCSLSRKLPPAI